MGDLNLRLQVKLVLDLPSDVSVQYLLELEVIETLHITEKKDSAFDRDESCI